jgi:flagellar hook-basal body complex protein FliE
LLARVYNGSYTGVKRLGIAIEPVTKAQDALKASTKNATDEQKRAAKAADKTATSQMAIGKLQKAFGGQAEAYGKTAAGAQDGSVSRGERAGEARRWLLPVITKVTNAVATFMAQMDSGKGAGGRFAAAISTGFNTAKNVIGAVVRTVKKFLQDHRQDIHDVIRAFQRVAAFARTTWQETLLPIVRRTVAAIKPIMEGLISTIRGLVRLVSGLLSGNWSKAWSGAKEAVSGAWKVIKTVVKTGIGEPVGTDKGSRPEAGAADRPGHGESREGTRHRDLAGHQAAAKAVPGLARDALKGIGKTILKGITGGLGGGIAGAIGGLVGDGIGKAGASGSLPIGGAFGGSLMGARSSLAPFAAIGSRFGLNVSPVAPPGIRHSSGNVSVPLVRRGDRHG